MSNLYQKERKERLLRGAPIGLVAGSGDTGVVPLAPPSEWPFQVHFDKPQYEIGEAEGDQQLKVTYPDSPEYSIRGPNYSNMRSPDYPADPGYSKQLWAGYTTSQWSAIEVALPSAVALGSGVIRLEMMVHDSGSFTKIGMQIQDTFYPSAIQEAVGIQWVGGLDYPQSIDIHGGSGSYAAGFTSTSWTYGEPLNTPVVMQMYINLATGYFNTWIIGRYDTNQGRQTSGQKSKTMAYTATGNMNYARFFMDRTTASAHEKTFFEVWGAIDSTAFPAGDKV